jgi:chromosome segregation ATPase
MKRAKNNDAVRRSREKAKQQLNEKERRLIFLEAEHNEHYKQMNALKQKVRELEAENKALRNSCNCGVTQQLPFRR